LLNELDEVNEVLFFHTGSYDVGYEINHAQRFVVRCIGSNQIGAYGVMFNKRALFIYRTNEECRGYSIRKSRWVSIIRDNHDLLDELED
jgi:hypothetical protein